MFWLWLGFFFLVTVTVPCFGFRTGIMLTHWQFSYCWVGLTLNQELFRASCCPDSEEAGGKRTWEGTQPGHLTLTGQRGISNHMALCWKTKLGKLAGYIEHWSVGSEKLHHLLFMSFFPYYYLPLLFCPNELSLSQPTSFTFFPRFSLPSLWGEKEGMWSYTTTTWHCCHPLVWCIRLPAWPWSSHTILMRGAHRAEQSTSHWRYSL